MQVTISLLIKIIRSIKPAWFLLELLQYRLLHRYYKFSHKIYLSRSKPQWKELTKYLECKLYLKDIFANDSHPVSAILIRRKPGIEIQIDEISLTFEAKAGEFRYQEVILVKNLNNGTIVRHMPNIPIQNIYIINNRLFPSYTSFNILIHHIISKNNHIISNYISPSFSPMYFNFLNGLTKEKWGRKWNLNFFEEIKKEMEIIIQAALLSNFEISPCLRFSFWRSFRLCAVRLLTNYKVLSFLFWLFLMCKIIRITHSGSIRSRIPWINLVNIRRLLGIRNIIYSPW